MTDVKAQTMPKFGSLGNRISVPGGPMNPFAMGSMRTMPKNAQTKL